MTVLFSFVDHYHVLREEDLTFSYKTLGSNDKENQAPSKKKPRKVSRDLLE